MAADRSRTPEDAARYAAHLAHDADRPSIHDLTDDDARPPMVRDTATCGVCGQGVVDPLWCTYCANERAALLKARREEWDG